jgi:hypothetical protein
VKHVNTRFPDDLYDEMAAVATAEERWLVGPHRGEGETASGEVQRK